MDNHILYLAIVETGLRLSKTGWLSEKALSGEAGALGAERLSRHSLSVCVAKSAPTLRATPNAPKSWSVWHGKLWSGVHLHVAIA